MEQTINSRVLVFLLSSIGLITFPHVFHVPIPVISFFFVLLVWRAIGVWRPAYLPNQLLVFLLLLSGIALLVVMHQGVFGRDAGTAVFVTALGLKLLEIKTQRDLYLITYLAFIVAASQFLYVQNILMAAYSLMVCISLFGTLLCINSGSLGNLQSLKLAGKILLQAMPLMVVLFVFFPRVEAPRWSFLQEDNKALTGLSDTLQPGSISQLGLSGEKVFRAKFAGEIPPNNQRYWRGPVFSYTDGKRWEQTKNTYFKRHLDKVRFSGAAYQYKILMEPQSKNWVYALDMPAAFEQPLYENGTHQLLTSAPASKRAEYEITSYLKYNTGYITKTEVRENLQLPKAPEDRVKNLVAQLGGIDQSPEVFIRNLFLHFRENNFYYTLMPPLMESNPIETFLFDVQAGFCGHYATAFVYLMRVAGIPARVVGGYQGGEYNEAGGFIEVRQANAHAWAEVWLSGKGWVRYDPTTAIAPERVEQSVDIEQQIANNSVSFTPVQMDRRTLSLLKQARNLWSSVDYSWHRWVINYDRSHQKSFLSKLGISGLKKMLYWLLGLLAAITLILAVVMFRKQKTVLDAAQIDYQKACAKLTKLGLFRAETEAANDFLLRVTQQQPQVALAFSNITRLYVRARYAEGAGQTLLQLLHKQVASFHPKSK